MTTDTDHELDVIGSFIEAVTVGRARELTPAAWRRISDYALSLCMSAEREAADRERIAAKSPADDKGAAVPDPGSEPFHILRRRRRVQHTPA